MRKVCFVSEECVGVAEAGGIGACVRGLAQLLQDGGCQVDLLITDLTRGAQDLAAGGGSGDAFARRIFFLREVAAQTRSASPPGDSPSKSHHVYLFLKARDYDEVHFHDFLGLGFYTAMARRMGLYSALVVTHLHGSSAWVRQFNLNPPDIGQLEQEALERSQIENSDEAVSPSAYMLDWCRADGVALPRSVRRDWVLPQWLAPDGAADAPLRTRALRGDEIREIVFFGRHERRKGFRPFVDAVAALPPDLQPDVVFLGRFDRSAGEHSAGYALRKLRDYGGRLRFFNDYTRREAMAFLRRSPHALVAMPSLVENSPCVVGECFTLGLPFLTTQAGGTEELVDPASRAHCLAPPDAAGLSHALQRVLREGMPELVSTLNPRQIMANWQAPVEGGASVPAQGHPLVSVCLAHHERPQLLRRAVQAILAQTYDNVEIVVVDDGSRTPAATAYLDELECEPARFPVTVIRTPNRYLGAARNSAARAAKGEFLLFHDDDNYAEPHEIETFVRAALNFGADILTCLYYVFREGETESEGEKRITNFYTFGVGGDFSFFMNRFGDANALVRRSTFDEIGGFTEQRGVCFEDWEFFLKAHLAGKRMGIVPEPLFNYRIDPASMLANGDALMDYERVYQALDKLRPRVGADLVRLAYGEWLTALAQGRVSSILARERGADVLQKLAGLDPNAREAIPLLADLAVQYGRFADAVELGSKDFENRGHLGELLRDPVVRRRRRGSFELSVLEPTAARDAAYLSGWSIDGEGLAWDPAAVWVDGAWRRVMASRRLRRADVEAAFRLDSDRSLGFMLYVAADVVSPPEGQDSEPWQALGPAFRRERFEANLPYGPGRQGHIERGEWQQRAVVTIPDTLEGAPILEIETSGPADPIVVWPDGGVDWGHRLSPNRVRYAREGAEPQRCVTVFAPAHLRTYVTAT